MSAVEAFGTLVALGGPLLCLALAVLLVFRIRGGYLSLGDAALRLLVAATLAVVASIVAMIASIPALHGDGALAIVVVPVMTAVLTIPAWVVLGAGALLLRLARPRAQPEDDE